MSKRIISFHFTLRNKEGDILDQTPEESPLSFLEGSNNIIEGLEAELLKMGEGDKGAVIVRPEKGYGFRDESQIDVVDRSRLPVEEIKVGDFFQAGADRQAPVVQVVSVEGDKVTLDANHPLAGKDLFFDVEVVETRDATAEEIDHGYAHAAGQGSGGGCCGGGGNSGCGCD